MTGSDDSKWPPEAPTPEHNDIYVAVMGFTGAGKKHIHLALYTERVRDRPRPGRL